MKIKNILSLVLPMVLLQSCSDDDKSNNTPDETPTPISETITISETGLYPEGIDFNTTTNQFIVGSITRSEVGNVNPQTGAYSTFVTDENLSSVTGVFTDETRNRLLVASGNLGFSKNSSVSAPNQYAYLGIYNLSSGALIKGINLGALLPENTPVFANDIAVDTDGNIYVTDSFSPVIYKVDTALEASVFVNGGANFTPAPGGFGLNGIVYLNNRLIVNKLDDGTIFNIPIATPENYTKIEVEGDSTFVGGDGLEVTPEGNIILVENDLGDTPGTHLLSSTDQWKTASVVSLFDVTGGRFPTTAATANDGNTYVINAYLSKALNGDLSQETFTILRIK